jgi:TPR repeat protein
MDIENAVSYYKSENYLDAINIFNKLAQDDDPVALYYLGLCYRFGYGVIEDKTKAAEYFNRSAHLGYPDACFRMSYVYSNGDGAPVNVEHAIEWGKKAIKMGSQRGYCALGDAYCKNKEYDKAFAAYTDGVEKTDEPWPHVELSRMYLYGLGTKKDITKALQYAIKSYGMGINTIQNIVDMLKSNELPDNICVDDIVEIANDGVKKGYKNSNELLRLCASHKVGRGDPEDLSKAYRQAIGVYRENNMAAISRLSYLMSKNEVPYDIQTNDIMKLARNGIENKIEGAENLVRLCRFDKAKKYYGYSDIIGVYATLSNCRIEQNSYTSSTPVTGQVVGDQVIIHGGGSRTNSYWSSSCSFSTEYGLDNGYFYTMGKATAMTDGARVFLIVNAQKIDDLKKHSVVYAYFLAHGKGRIYCGNKYLKFMSRQKNIVKKPKPKIILRIILVLTLYLVISAISGSIIFNALISVAIFLYIIMFFVKKLRTGGNQKVGFGKICAYVTGDIGLPDEYAP